MSGSRSVLLLDGFDVSTEAVTARLRDLRLAAVRAKTADEAFALADAQPFVAVVLPSDLPGADASGVVNALRASATGRSVAFLAAGPEPCLEARAALREAGVELALFEPFDDALLRFQLNRALAAGQRLEQRPRRARRVPCASPVRAISAEREKPGRLYTLSEAGLFLETPRGSMRGVDVALELQIAGQVVDAAGRVALCNVPGNLRNPKLPIGIGVEFTRLGPGALEALRGTVETILPSLDV